MKHFLFKINIIIIVATIVTITLTSLPAQAYQGMPTPKLHINGRFLKDPNGTTLNLHGYMQPGSSWFNGENRNFLSPNDFTNPANVAPALNFYNSVADILTHTGPLYNKNHGWYCNYVRFIGDGSSPENFAPGWDAKGNLANPTQFNAWMKNLIVPYIKHCKSDGLYVVLVGNPSLIYPGDDKTRNMTQLYQQNLITFWKKVASHPGIKNADNVMFEICNEPIAIESQFGAKDWRSGDDSHWSAITSFMQPIADAIRSQGADNIIWIPGLGWQGEYQGFAPHPVTGRNIGYAAHLYPGYGGSHNNPALVEKLWNNNYKPCADKYPMIITEMAWNPNEGKGYQDLFNGSTKGFGNAAKACIDKQGNVSYQLGMVGDFIGDLNKGLSKATIGNNESAQAAFEWYQAYTK